MARRQAIVVGFGTLGLAVLILGAAGYAQSAAASQSVQYHVTAALNCASADACTVARLPGDADMGVWLTFELNQDGTGTYKGADCARNIGGTTGNFPDSGPVTWQAVTTYDPVAMKNVDDIEIKGVTLVKGTTSVTISVPASAGQYSLDASQAVQVAQSSVGVQFLSGSLQVDVSQ